MAKQGPCYHCGATSTPLWRNGPPEKPVLCNACGSRWRTKGTLANYVPLHARAEANGYEDQRVSRLKSVTVNKNKEMKTPKRKPNQENELVKRAALDFARGFEKAVDEDTSNRSSSGSAISNSGSCAQFECGDMSDLTGGILGESPSQSNAWDAVVPSKKRTCVGRPKPSHVEKLTKDLYTILQEQQSSCFSCSSEDDLLFESETPMVSVEIGHGSVLIRHPHSSGREEESEASSLSVENKNLFNEAYSRSMRRLEGIDEKGFKFLCNRDEKAKNFDGLGIQEEEEQLKRNKSQNEKSQILGICSSQMCSIDLKDIFNFEEFVGQFTIKEQQQLMKLLPLQDTSRPPDSLRSMFDSAQFKENFSFFEQLFARGVFDMCSSGAKPEDCKMLRKLALSEMNKSHLVESYHQFKKRENATRGLSPRGISSNVLNDIVPMKRSSESHNKKISESKTGMWSPKSAVIMKPSCQTKETTSYNDVSCFSPRTLFVCPPDGSSEMFGYGNSDQDLLLDVPSNGSFPQAELLRQL